MWIKTWGIPAQGLLEIARFRQSLAQQPRPADVSPVEWKERLWKQCFARVDEWLDYRPAVRHLADPRLATEIVKALKFFASERYDLVAWAVMPSHVHWVFRPCDCVRDEEELERIVDYIHANPVRAGLVVRPEDFAFSSAREHARCEGRMV